MIVEKTESHNSLPASAPTINRSHGSLKERKIVFREPYQRSRIDKERSENHSTIQPKPTSHKTNMFKPIHIEISSKGYKGNLLHKAMVCALAVIILFYGLMLQHESERSMLNLTSDMGSMSTSLTKHLTLQLTSVRDRISQNQTTAVLSATNTKSTAIRKLSNFVESFDEFDYPTPCQDAPSYGDPDNDTTRYHLLRRVQHALDFPSRKNETESSSSRELLCIFPFFPLDLEHTALVTYGQECDGALILRADNNDMKIESYPNIDNGIPTFILHLDLTSQGHNKWKQDLLYYLSNTVTRPYGWIHWAPPRRYTFIGFVRSAIREAEETEGE